MLDFNKIRQAFFGSSEARRTAVVTPISRIYSGLANNYNAQESGGWYKAAFLPHADTMIVKTGQGRSVVDVIMASDADQVIHIGYCGALRNYAVGDTVVASTVSHIRECGTFPRDAFIKVHQPEGTVLSVDSFLLDEDIHDIGCCDLIDMESYWVYRFSRNPLSVMMITDMPGIEMFYDVRADDARLASGLKKLIGAGAEYIG